MRGEPKCTFVSSLAPRRRATYKAEESVVKLEAGKKAQARVSRPFILPWESTLSAFPLSQDLIIDNLNEKLKRSQAPTRHRPPVPALPDFWGFVLQDELALNEAQLQAQRNETSAANQAN